MVVAGVGRERRIGKTLVVAAVCREVEGGESGDEEEESGVWKDAINIMFVQTSTSCFKFKL